MKKILLWCLFFFLSASSGPIVFGQSSYDDAFCEYYSYTVECYTYWAKAQTKISNFVEVYVASLQTKSPEAALTKLRNMDDQLAQAVQYYSGTHWEYLIRFFRDQLLWPLAQIEEDLLTIRLDSSFLTQELQVATSKEVFYSRVRAMIISQLIAWGYDGFIQRPYKDQDASWLLMTDSNQLFVTSEITEQDALDRYLLGIFGESALWSSVPFELKLSPSLVNGWKWQVHLFTSAEDLQALWYQVVSHRVRTNNDEAYRRTNIATAFDQIGHVRVLNPGDEISYMEDSNFDPYAKQLYQDGFVIFLDEEVEDYGWGLCGGSTAIYQGIVTNKSLSKPALRNHSKRYHHLYNATIDGEWVDTPGIDSTIYSNSLDLRMRNISNHPIILVLNYEGGIGEAEEVFTVWYASDKWSMTYVSSRPYYASLSTKWWWSRKVTGQCHTRNINGVNRESCYKEIKK